MAKVLFRMAKEFQDVGNLNPSNCAWIFLTPKVEGANDIRDFRQINLANWSYKIIVKLIANILKGVIGQMVEELHASFIKERSILDSVAVDEEAINHLKECGNE